MTREAPDDWPFDQRPNAAAITVRSILDGAPILLVSHDEDDHGWQFLDGRPPDPREGRVIGMGSALERDPSLREVADLPPGWIATRPDATSPWIREPNARAADDDAEGDGRGSIWSRLRRSLGGR